MDPSPAKVALDQINGVTRTASTAAAGARRQYRRHIRGVTEVTMRPATMDVDGLELHYAVSSNDSGDHEQLWAINIHGYFAGGEMYHRESERLAESLGWRVVNPSLPGFGGSQPLSWGQISMPSLARRIEAVMDQLDIDRAIILGHSMGGGVAVEFAARHPERTLGVVYRAGVATPAWHHRRGLLPLAMSAVAPDVAPIADLVAAVAFDVPDLFVGRMLSTIRSVLPDLRRNLKTLARTAPVASMLMEVEQTAQVVSFRRAGVPVLAEWGCFDRIVTAATAQEFSQVADTEVLWVPGGHSWMLARPTGQRDILRHLPIGRSFLDDVVNRQASTGGQLHLRAVG